MKKYKLGFIGAGQLAQSIMRALLDTKTLEPADIYASNRSEARLDKVVEKFGIHRCNSNEKLVESVDIVIIATKPQDIVAAIEPVTTVIDEDKIIISLAAGFDLHKLKKLLPNNKKIIRLMTNTPVKISQAVVGYAMTDEALLFEDDLKSLFSPLGVIMPIPDGESFQAFTIASASGTGFILELMQYWQEWIEGYGIESDLARKITVQTFLGTAALASKQSQMSLEELQSQVTSKKGTTATGLDSMRENEIERLLRLSFEKAVLRDSELSS